MCAFFRGGGVSYFKGSIKHKLRTVKISSLKASHTLLFVIAFGSTDACIQLAHVYISCSTVILHI